MHGARAGALPIAEEETAGSRRAPYGRGPVGHGTAAAAKRRRPEQYWRRGARSGTVIVIVCIDYQSAVAQRAGVGRYTRALVRELGACAGQDRIRAVYFDFQRRSGGLQAGPGIEERAVRWCPGRAAQAMWKRLDWPPYDWFAGAADVFHFPNFIAPPVSRGAIVATVHDASFLRFPLMAERANLQYLSARIGRTLERAEAVITDSEFSAAEIAELLRVPASRLIPIHLGVEPGMARPGPDRIQAVRRALGLDAPYILAVGTIEPRKNLDFLIGVFERLPFFDGHLALAGMRGWRCAPILERARRSPRSDSIRFLDYVPDSDLPALYSGAELLAFPSLYEGFGLPPLEAMACGTPVLASGIPVLREVLGTAARLVDGFDEATWADAAEELLGSPSLRERLAAAGLAQAARYNWAETARRTWEVYREMGSRQRRRTEE